MWEKVPLDTPYTVGLFIGDYCNFKCNYCVQSLPANNPERNHLVKQFMGIDTCKKAIESLNKFPNKIKLLTIHANGEPTLNPNLPDFIKLAYESGCAEKVQVITNGSMLTEELSRRMIDAGLQRIIVSVQGVTAESYKRVCGYNIDFEEFLKQLRYLYDYSRNHGVGCHIHAKIMDVALSDGEDKIFYKMFSDCSDSQFIGHIVNLFKGVDYSELVTKGVNLFGEEQTGKLKCCPYPFFQIYVQANGDIVPCCISHQPICYGNIADISVYDAWYSERRRQFLIDQLRGERFTNEACIDCGYIDGMTTEADVLDGHLDVILSRM